MGMRDHTEAVNSGELWVDPRLGLIGLGGKIVKAPYQVCRLAAMLIARPRSAIELQSAFTPGTAYVYVCKLRKDLECLGVRVELKDGKYELDG